MAVGYIYRHPCMQQSEFNDEYLKPLSEKLISENKEVILLGGFTMVVSILTQIEMFLTFLTSYIPLILFLKLLLQLD